MTDENDDLPEEEKIPEGGDETPENGNSAAGEGESEPESGMDYEDLSADGRQTADEEPETTDTGEPVQRTAHDLEPVFDVPVNVQAVLGRSHVEVSDLLKLSPGNVVELDRKVGEAIDIYVNNRLVARGEVVLVEDHLGVTMTEIIKGDAA